MTKKKFSAKKELKKLNNLLKQYKRNAKEPLPHLLPLCECTEQDMIADTINLMRNNKAEDIIVDPKIMKKAKKAKANIEKSTNLWATRFKEIRGDKEIPPMIDKKMTEPLVTIVDYDFT